RAGLIATNSIRGGRSRLVLEAIQESGAIFAAWSDEPWVVDGANVRVSIVAQDDGTESTRTLNGHPVLQISSQLTGAEAGASDLSLANRLPENASRAFVADVKGGS